MASAFLIYQLLPAIVIVVMIVLVAMIVPVMMVVAVAIVIPAVIVLETPVRPVPVTCVELLAIVVRPNPARACIGRLSPITFMPAVVLSHRIPIAFHPQEVRTGTNRVNANDMRWRWRSDSDSD